MNILVFSWRGPKHPNAGGAEQVMHQHMTGWTQKGYNVTLFTSTFKGSKKDEKIDGVKIIRKGNQILGVHLLGFFWFLKNGKKFDLVVDQFHGIPFFTPLFVKGKKVAVLQEVARGVWFENQLPLPFNWILGFIGFVSEPLVFLLYKNVPFVVGSNSAKEELSKYFIPKSNITIVPHGVTLKEGPKIVKKGNRKIVSFLGAVAKDKGIEDAIKTFSLLENENMDFWVIGKSSKVYKKHLKVYAKKLGIAKVKFWGFVDESKKFELLKKTHLLINPSTREGWGLVNIEANSVGTPVISYKAPGLVDSVRDGVSGIIVDKNTPEDLAKTIRKVLNDKKLFSKLQQGSVDWSKSFKWEKSKKMSLKLIEKILEIDSK